MYCKVPYNPMVISSDSPTWRKMGNHCPAGVTLSSRVSVKGCTVNQNQPSNKPLFSSEQRRQLGAFDLNDDQINELETALQLCRLSLLPPPKRGEVRSELQSLSGVLQNAQKMMSNFLGAGPQSPARQEALQRVMLADTEIRNEDDCIKKTLDAVNVAYTAVQQSEHDFPNDQQRNKASPFAVSRIEKALRNGFEKRHSSNDPGKP